MRNLIKKIMLLAMIGMIQVGFSATVLEASKVQSQTSPSKDSDKRKVVIHFDDRHNNLQNSKIQPQSQTDANN
ncbi:MAG: hypothetical protein H6Q70_1333 [Firmicutes bacterium]|nr:hypothetical protein [Bacillota bacterium]